MNAGVWQWYVESDCNSIYHNVLQKHFSSIWSPYDRTIFLGAVLDSCSLPSLVHEECLRMSQLRLFISTEFCNGNCNSTLTNILANIGCLLFTRQIVYQLRHHMLLYCMYHTYTLDIYVAVSWNKYKGILDTPKYNRGDRTPDEIGTTELGRKDCNICLALFTRGL